MYPNSIYFGPKYLDRDYFKAKVSIYSVRHMDPEDLVLGIGFSGLGSMVEGFKVDGFRV